MAHVSVVVAAKDAAPVLGEALASVAAQRFGDWEAIVVDDGSADATAEVARTALGDRVRVLVNERPQGPGAARNRAAAAASGELLAFLDSDDTWDPGYLEHQVGRFAGTARLGLAAVDARLLGPSGPAGCYSDRVPMPRTPDLTALLRANPLQTPAVVCRARAFVEAGGFAADMLRGEDYDLWLRIAEAGWQLTCEPIALVTVRLRPDGLSSDTAGLARDTAAVYERALARSRLTGRQRRLARRQRRLQRLVARRAERYGAAAGERARIAALSTLVALEHPERWAAWRRRGVREPGPGRHA